MLGGFSLPAVIRWSEPTGTGAHPGRNPTGAYIHDVWWTKDGLPQNSVNAVVQTRDGYLWVGTRGGLARRTPEHWFNTDAFAFPMIGTSGNAGRNILDGPGFQNVNASLVKNTALTETINLQLRAKRVTFLTARTSIYRTTS